MASGKAFDWKIFARLYQYSKPYRGGFAITLLLVLVLSGLTVVRPEQMRNMLDVAVPGGNALQILNVAIWFFVVLALEITLQYIQTLAANSVAQSITLDMRERVFAQVIRYKLNYFDKTPVGQLVTRHIGDIDGIAEVFSVGLLDIIRDTLKLLVIVGFMFFLDWKLTLIVMLPIPILLWATRLFQQAVKKSFQDVRNEVARMNVFVQEHVTGMNIVQFFNRQKIENEKFVEINAQQRDAHIRGIWAYSVFFPVVEILSALSVSLLLWWGVKSSLNLEMSPGLILEFSTFIAMMYRPIRQMADNFNVLQMGVVNAERVFKLMDEDHSEEDAIHEEMKDVKGRIEFRNVSFQYVENQPILTNFNMMMDEGKSAAIVGSTGSGKSTLISLLNRFYEVNQGEIFIDEVSLAKLPLVSLRKTIGIVLQDVFLFSDSIRNNLTLYNPEISEDRMIAAAKMVGAHDFIMALPGGYDFDVKERGNLLSTGQRQLLAFVRVFLQDPKIVILDEATSSIDTETELLIQRATELLTKNRTSIIIAHRLSTIQQADVIFVMEKGKIIEQGSHSELMNLGGHYCTLVELQYKK
jgi:ATP-binding cassette subfamily B protein